MKIFSSCTAAALLASLSTPSFAAGTPTGLFNKTVTIVWGQSNTWRRVSDGVQGSSTNTIQRQIYFSSAGRTFVRHQGRSGIAVNKADIAPETQSGRFEFSGNTMQHFMGREGLLWHFTVNFDPSFSSCNASLTLAREGKGAVTTGIDGAKYENLSNSVASVQCSVTNGNAFAGG